MYRREHIDSPGASEYGGRVMQIAAFPASHTGRFLAEVLGRPAVADAEEDEVAHAERSRLRGRFVAAASMFALLVSLVAFGLLDLNTAGPRWLVVVLAVTNAVLSSAVWIFWGSRLPAFWIASSSTRVASWACTAKLVGSVPVFFL